MFLWRVIAAFSLILALTLGAACGKDGKEGAAAPAAPLWKASGNEGNVTGVINFTGAVPAAKKLDMSSDSKCEGVNFLDDAVVKDGKLQNVFIFVKSGLPQASFETPTGAVTLDQRGCKYTPRVLGIRAGQPLEIINSDQTNHNIHTLPRVNREFDGSQLAGQGPITRKFAKPEAVFPVKCNQHSWMRAYIAVLEHPFFAVSDTNGAFTIKGLPPGEYEIEAWHERYGAKTSKIKVAEKADAKVDFTFDGSVAYQPGSLKIQPAMMIP
jgi:plastocyanin